MILGITGTIGAGKSSVAQYFKKQGYPVFDADKMVHAYYEKGAEIYEWLLSKYGSSILHEDGSLNHKALAHIVFNSENELDALEHKVFPKVKEEILKLKNEYQDEVIFIEVPLLFEAEFEQLFDKIIMVDAFKKHRHTRLLKKGFLMKDIVAREKRQYGSHYKKQNSDIIINNNQDLKHLYDKLDQFMKGEGL